MNNQQSEIPMQNTNIETTNTDTNHQDENQDIFDISNAAHSMSQQQLNPPQPIIPSQAPIPTTLDDFINTALTIEEKRKLRYDLLSLPPEKLGEIMYVLQKSQPQNIEQKGDELEIDLKKLNTKTLRHLQRYVESVFAKVRYNSIISTQQQQQMFMQQMQPQQNMIESWSNQHQQQQHQRLSVNDLIPNNRKRSYQAMLGYDNINGNNGIYRHQRKKRSAFTLKQKEEMIKFWQSVNWQAIADDAELEAAGNEIGVTVPQLKVFRQNNRKKYAGKDIASSTDTSPARNTTELKQEEKQEIVEEDVEEEEIIEIGKVGS